ASFWAIVGVVLGFALGEGSRLVRGWFRIARLKKLVRDELLSIRMQIPQKREIVGNIIASLDQRKLLPGISVSAVNTGYRHHISEVYEHLSLIQRNCLHVIHEHLRLSDEIVNRFFDDFQAVTRNKVVDDPFRAFKSMLSEIDGSYQKAETLITSYLSNKPIDV